MPTVMSGVRDEEEEEPARPAVSSGAARPAALVTGKAPAARASHMAEPGLHAHGAPPHPRDASYAPSKLRGVPSARSAYSTLSVGEPPRERKGAVTSPLGSSAALPAPQQVSV